MLFMCKFAFEVLALHYILRSVGNLLPNIFAANNKTQIKSLRLLSQEACIYLDKEDSEFISEILGETKKEV